MRQGDIFEDKTAMATLDTVESLYPGLPPSEDGSEIEMNMANTGGGDTPNSRSTITVSNTEIGANGDG